MLFRCSVCRGQFDVEPDLKKPVIFCSHCGAALKTGLKKPPVSASAADNSALQALSGEESPLDQLAAASQSAPPSTGYVETYETTAPQPAYEQTSPVSAYQNAPSNDLYNFAPPPQPQQSTYAPPSIRRPIKKKNNTVMILVIIIIAFVALIAIGGCVGIGFLLFSAPSEPVKQTPKAPPRPPGELFPDK